VNGYHASGGDTCPTDPGRGRACLCSFGQTALPFRPMVALSGWCDNRQRDSAVGRAMWRSAMVIAGRKVLVVEADDSRDPTSVN